METIEAIPTNNVKNLSKHLFTFSDNDKGELYNLIQYALLAVIPIVSLNKTINHIIPDVDEDKSSFEITFEIIFQISFLFVGMFFIHRLITFIPTFSGVSYNDLHILNNVIAFLVIVLSIQSRLGEKVNLLFIRSFNLFNSLFGFKHVSNSHSNDSTNDSTNNSHSTNNYHSPSNADLPSNIPSNIPSTNKFDIHFNDNTTPSIHEPQQNIPVYEETVIPANNIGFSSSFSPFQ